MLQLCQLRELNACDESAGWAGLSCLPSAMRPCCTCRRAVILQLGHARELDAAEAAFARMRQAGIWQPTDSMTVGYLLNALSADATRLHAR